MAVSVLAANASGQFFTVTAVGIPRSLMVTVARQVAPSLPRSLNGNTGRGGTLSSTSLRWTTCGPAGRVATTSGAGSGDVATGGVSTTATSAAAPSTTGAIGGSTAATASAVGSGAFARGVQSA